MDEAITDENQIKNIITGQLTELGRLPTQVELGKLLNVPHQKAVGHLKKYEKDMIQLNVLPSGKIRTTSGELVWYRNTRGSLVLASHRHIEGLGHVIDG